MLLISKVLLGRREGNLLPGDLHRPELEVKLCTLPVLNISGEPMNAIAKGSG